jgi:hypothetical protein
MQQPPAVSLRRPTAVARISAILAKPLTVHSRSRLHSDYCQQDDREDGLSGSVSSKGGETGLFGGSIDGTVTRQDDQPPKLLEIIPKSMLKKGKIRSN